MKTVVATTSCARASGIEEVLRGESVMGDSSESAIRDAQAMGMKAIWKMGRQWAACNDADAVCFELSELPDIIQAL